MSATYFARRNGGRFEPEFRLFLMFPSRSLPPSPFFDSAEADVRADSVRSRGLWLHGMVAHDQESVNSLDRPCHHVQVSNFACAEPSLRLPSTDEMPDAEGWLCVSLQLN